MIYNGKPLIFIFKYDIMSTRGVLFMSKNYLLIYSEQLATDIELLCRNIKSPSNTLFSKFAKAPVAFMQIFVKPITDKAKLICCQNLKSHLKSVVKQKVGCSYCLIHM